MKETAIKSNSRKAMKYRGAECLNCGHPLDLTDRFCAYCGQINTTKRLTLKDFFNEFLLSVFTYDSRFRHTVKDLLFKPGTITRYYIEGKRFHYANPFRFFLSASIIYFLLLGITDFVKGDSGNKEINFNNNIPGIEQDLSVADSIVGEVNKLENQNINIDLTDLENDINEAIIEGRERQKRKKVKDSTNTLEYTYKHEDSLENSGWLGTSIEKGILFYKFYKATEIKNVQEGLDSLHYKQSKTNKWLYQRNATIERIENNPVRFARYLTSKTPFFLFFLAPLLGLFFWLVYSKKKYNYMEHLVFIFHILSFVFLILLIAYIPDLLLGEEVFSAIFLILLAPFYFYKALRNFYKQNRVITIIKFVFLNFVYGVLATITALIFFAITAAFY